MKTHVIADIHGCRNELESLLEKLNPDLSRERIIFTGDMIDRGPDSHGVIRIIRTMQQTYGKEQVVVLRGNHEQMMMDALDKFSSSWLYNGGEQTRASYHGDRAVLMEDVAFFASLPLIYEDEYSIYVHAGLRPGVLLVKQDPEDMLWIREQFYQHSTGWEKRIVFGHTPTLFLSNQTFPWIEGQLIGIDTGCAYGGALTAITMNKGEVIEIQQAPSESMFKWAS